MKDLDHKISRRVVTYALKNKLHGIRKGKRAKTRYPAGLRYAE